MEQELLKQIDGLRRELDRLKEAFRLHTHNGIDSLVDFRANTSQFWGNIGFPYITSERGGRDASITTPNGFGLSISEAIGASQYGAVQLTSQTGSLLTGGTSSNGEIGLYDGSGTASKYFKLYHTGNGTPVIETDALPTSNPGGTGILWNSAGTVKIT